MSNKRKAITLDVFDEVKRYLSFSTRKDTATALGLSLAVVGVIDRSETFDDYLAFNEERRTHYTILDNANLQELSGEPLFWEIHSTLRRVPIKFIAQKARLSLDEVSAMKAAQDYEEYLRIKDTHRYHPIGKNSPNIINKYKQNDIRKRYADGETIEELAKAYGISKSEIQAIIEKPIEEPIRKPTRKAPRLVNRAIAEIIKEGKKQRITNQAIAEALGVSVTSIWRILKMADWSATDGLYDRWQKHSLQYHERQYYREGEDFYMFSLRKYLGLEDYPYWWEKRQTTHPVIMPAEEVKSVETVETVEEEGVETEPTPEPEPKTTSITVPVKLEQDGKNLTLTININLTMAL